MSSIYNIVAPTVSQPNNVATSSHLIGDAETNTISPNGNSFIQVTCPISCSTITATNLYGTASLANNLPDPGIAYRFTASYAMNFPFSDILIKSLTVSMTTPGTYQPPNGGPFTATITHNLGFKPSIIRWVLVATVDGTSFAIGDEVDVFAANGPAPEQHQGGATIYTNTTTSRLYLFASNTSGQTSGTVILDRNNNQLAVLNTQWQAKCYYSTF